MANKIFQDENGKISAMRIMSFYVVFAVTTVWAIISIRNNAMFEIDTSQIIAILGAMGMKVGQKYIEVGNGEE